MATRNQRLSEFDGRGVPPPDRSVQLLCEDHSGTYQLPFACRWSGEAWQNVTSGDTIHATVIGWRIPPERNNLRRSNRQDQQVA